MLLTKEAHITQLPQDTTKQALSRGMKITVTSIPTNTAYYNMAGQYLPSRPSFDPTNPFLKKDVRKALNLAINREAIQKALFSRNDEAMIGVFMHPSMRASAVSADQWKQTYTQWEQRFKELYPYNPEEAKRLLAQAGYPNGFTLTLYNFPQPAAPQAREMNEFLALAWGKIGLKVNLSDREFDAVRAMYRKRDKENMGVAIWMSTSRWDPLIWNRGQVQFYSQGAVGGFEQEYIDVRMERILKSVDPVERGKLEMEMLQHNQEEYGYIPMMWMAGEFIYNPEFVAEYKTLGIHGTRDLEYVKGVLK
jgi:ABC-type transport system substrate-binding protein